MNVLWEQMSLTQTQLLWWQDGPVRCIRRKRRSRNVAPSWFQFEWTGSGWGFQTSFYPKPVLNWNLLKLRKYFTPGVDQPKYAPLKIFVSRSASNKLQFRGRLWTSPVMKVIWLCTNKPPSSIPKIVEHDRKGAGRHILKLAHVHQSLHVRKIQLKCPGFLF